VIAKYIDQETSHQKLVRQQHAQQIQSQSLSAQYRARVFYWMKSNEQGFRIRTEIPQNNVERVWSSYGPEQKRYTPFFHEWDICSDFDPFDDQEMDYSDGNEELEHSLDTPDQFSPEQILVSNALAADVYIEDLQASYSSLACYPKESAMALVKANDDFESILYTRYGLSVTNGHVSVATCDSVHFQRRALGDNSTLLHDEWDPTLECLVDHLSVSSLELPSQVPWLDRDVFDMDTMKALFSATHLTVTPFYDSQKVLLYDMRHKNQAKDGPEWTLVVQDATTALQCLRTQWGKHGILSLALELAQRAIPFKTLVSSDTPSVESDPEPRYDVGLGWRPQSWKPGLCEYRLYESIQDKFFNQEHSRAAFLAGGIVWRLAVESVGIIDMDRIWNVSSYALMRFHHTSNYLGYAYDDYLAEDEEDLICGVYNVSTGM
jgi:hypothetical protein